MEHFTNIQKILLNLIHNLNKANFIARKIDTSAKEKIIEHANFIKEFFM